MKKYNQLENKDCKPHTYRIQDKLLVRNKKSNKYEQPYVGPYPITQIWKNVIVALRHGDVEDRINIRWIKPYHES